MRQLLLLAVLVLDGADAWHMQVPTFHSPAIVDGKLAETYGCGKDVAPPIVFDAIPQGTTSLELTMIDKGGVGPYAGEGKGFVHWHVLGLPGTISAYPRDGALPAGVRETVNGFGKTGYGGPCPPHPPHLYAFSVTAAPSGARYQIDFTY